MNRIMVTALMIALCTSGNAALADGSPELNRPFAELRTYRAAPAVASMGGPIASDGEARARLAADGYRGITLTRGSDGIWYGTAIRGAARVNVQVGPDGRIVTR